MPTPFGKRVVAAMCRKSWNRIVSGSPAFCNSSFLRRPSAWHCAHPYGKHSISIHLPIGGDQQPTAAQLASLSALLDALGEDYSFFATLRALESLTVE